MEVDADVDACEDAACGSTTRGSCTDIEDIEVANHHTEAAAIPSAFAEEDTAVDQASVLALGWGQAAAAADAASQVADGPTWDCQPEAPFQ